MNPGQWFLYGLATAGSVLAIGLAGIGVVCVWVLLVGVSRVDDKPAE